MCSVYMHFIFPMTFDQLVSSTFSRFDDRLKLRQLHLVAGHAVDSPVDSVVYVAVGLVEHVPQQSQGHCFK